MDRMDRGLAAPTGTHEDPREANRRGIRLMVLSMSSFVVNDALVKYVSQTLPSGQLIFVRGVLATLLVLLVLRLTGGVVQPRQLASRWVLIRSFFDGLATLAYLISLFHLPLANATAINMATPLMITLVAVVWLRTRVGPRRWLAVAAGFAGVLLVIQPRLEGFNAFAWLCLLGTVLHALRDLSTLRIGREVPSGTVTLATSLSVTLMAGLLASVQGWAAMTWTHAALLAAAAVFLANGYQLMIRATRSGDLSLVAPFRYSGLLVALLLGWAVWGDVPNALAWAGIALLLGAGLYLLRHGR
mgnify:CR=1 FL=1